MTISNLDLSGFVGDELFDYSNLSNFKFGGVYIIYSIDESGNREIVKIGESNFIFRRIANYLTAIPANDLRCDEKIKKDKKITKRTIQCEMLKGKAKNLTYKVIWRIVEEAKERKELEKDLIRAFSKENGTRPVMNRLDR